jgi:predicted transglutaminase-like cysteine proteinase
VRFLARLGGLAVMVLAVAGPALAQPADAPPAEAPPPPASAEQAAAIEGALQDLFSAPLPQAGPDVFGYAAVEIGATRLEDQWRRIIQEPAPELAGPWAGLVGRIRSTSLLSRIQAVNSFTNHHLVFADDPSIYGVADHWAGLAETLAQGRGDCEDFAITKMQLLAAAGVPTRDLYLILVRDTGREIDHAVAAVRDGDRLYILDSANDAVRTADQVKGYRPVASFSGENHWTFGLRTAAAPTAGVEAQPAAEPARPGEMAPVEPTTPPFH